MTNSPRSTWLIRERILIKCFLCSLARNSCIVPRQLAMTIALSWTLTTLNNSNVPTADTRCVPNVRHNTQKTSLATNIGKSRSQRDPSKPTNNTSISKDSNRALAVTNKSRGQTLATLWPANQRSVLKTSLGELGFVTFVVRISMENRAAILMIITREINRHIRLKIVQNIRRRRRKSDFYDLISMYNSNI